MREWICINSFLQKGHQYQIYSYDLGMQVPSGACLLDAREVIPHADYCAHLSLKSTSYASFSDKFRYKMLYENGGWWVDADVVCFKSEIPISYSQSFLCWQHYAKINNAIMKINRGDLSMKYCLREVEEWEGRALKEKSKLPQGGLGPHLLSKAFQLHDRCSEVYPMRYGYPWHWTEAMSIFGCKHWDLNLLHAKTEDSFFGHLWNEILNKKNIDKNFQGEPGSFWRYLVDQHMSQELLVSKNLCDQILS